MIDLEQLKKCNDHEWHKPYGGQITLNCEDVDILLKAFDKACEEEEKDFIEKTGYKLYCGKSVKEFIKNMYLSEVSK